MNRNWIVMGLFAGTMLIGATAAAGARWGSEVVIDMNAHKALGTLANVRASNDSVQSIGCAVRTGNGGTVVNVQCYATDATGLSVQCTGSQPAFVQAAGAITSNSHLAFKWDDQGACTYLSVENYSSNAPVEP